MPLPKSAGVLPNEVATASHRPSGLNAASRPALRTRTSDATRRCEVVSHRSVPVPSEVGVARILPSGLKTAASSPDSAPWSNPSSSGWVVSADRSVLRVSAVGSSRSAAAASSKPRSA